MDSGYNYCHISHPNHILYATKWSLEPIPYDDIDVDHLYEATASLFPEEDDEMALASMKTGGPRRKGKHSKPVWEDLSLEKFLSETPLEGYRDQTMVRAMYTADDESEGINEVLSNGYNVSHMAFNPSSYGSMQSPPPLGYEPPSFTTPATPRIRAPSATLSETPRVRQTSAQTPRVPSGTPRNQTTPFQTPITRIMR
ncbi:hypothetical protein DIURU_002312 [Diutina rugosa]|uniref:Uncharacterized protein n=1 Tax=Diutina rugosa TaxID=5481 RepID=A0A642UR10_DIURU|nr:uncharacterized protein DIURU_002312 [Diutina rugosa]KAA8903800.1 hypothetical protein DIURU_002312 [Diutina rugosa]